MKKYLMDRMYKASSGIANGIFVTLGIGILIHTIGTMFHLPVLIMIGTVAKLLMPAAIGAGIAIMLGSNTLVIFSAMITSVIGSGAFKLVGETVQMQGGEPIGALFAGTIATYVGKRVTGKTPLDMIAIPASAILIGGITGYYLAQVIQPMLTSISAIITQGVATSPILGPIVISVVWALLLVSPASSAALAIALSLDPIASGAALIGTTAQFAAYAFGSIRQNDLGGFLAQFICTPKVQLPNIVRNPRVMIAPLVAAAICAPIATQVFGFTATAQLGGLGLCSLIAPLSIFNTQGLGVLTVYLFTGVVMPVVISQLVNILLAKRQWVRPADLKMQVE